MCDATVGPRTDSENEGQRLAKNAEFKNCHQKHKQQKKLHFPSVDNDSLLASRGARNIVAALQFDGGQQFGAHESVPLRVAVGGAAFRNGHRNDGQESVEFRRRRAERFVGQIHIRGHDAPQQIGLLNGGREETIVLGKRYL